MRGFEGYQKGVNFGGWLSQCDYSKDRLENFIKAKDFGDAKEMGFDHIRVPVDYNIILDDDGNFVEEGFSYIDFAIENCRKNGLNMVLDLHKTPGYSFDPFHNEKGLFESEKYQNIFYCIWEEFAKRYGKDADMLSFELLNEVTKKEYLETWLMMAEHTVGLIRKYSKDIRILLGGYYNNCVEAVADLPKPYDENIVYNFHFYEPLLFTHQGAPWIEPMNTKFRCPFYMTYGEYEKLSSENLNEGYSSFLSYDPDKVIDADYFEGKLLVAIKVAQERNVPLYCGEYGVIDRADKAEAAKWFEVFETVMDKYQIGRAVWNYKEMDFGQI